MKVLLTRDVMGVIIWKPDTIVQFTSNKPIGVDSDQLVWLDTKFSFFNKNQILTSKQVDKYFPELYKIIKIGEKKLVDLHATEI